MEAIFLPKEKTTLPSQKFVKDCLIDFRLAYLGIEETLKTKKGSNEFLARSRALLQIENIRDEKIKQARSEEKKLVISTIYGIPRYINNYANLRMPTNSFPTCLGESKKSAVLSNAVWLQNTVKLIKGTRSYSKQNELLTMFWSTFKEQMEKESCAMKEILPFEPQKNRAKNAVIAEIAACELFEAFGCTCQNPGILLDLEWGTDLLVRTKSCNLLVQIKSHSPENQVGFFSLIDLSKIDFDKKRMPDGILNLISACRKLNFNSKKPHIPVLAEANGEGYKLVDQNNGQLSQDYINYYLNTVDNAIVQLCLDK